jgi:amidase
MTICCAISTTGLPAIAVPAGFTESGLPVGVQIVGRPRGDFELLQIARGFEQATRWGEKRPTLLES